MRHYTRTLAGKIFSPLFWQKLDNTRPKSQPPIAEEVEVKRIFCHLTDLVGSSGKSVLFIT